MLFYPVQALRRRLSSMRNLNPARIVVVSFGIIILVGTLLLMLPISSRDGQSTDLVTCLFTATSASCVTGLILVDTWAHWTLFGQFVILVMIQLGGLGFMTVITTISLALLSLIHILYSEYLEEYKSAYEAEPTAYMMMAFPQMVTLPVR